MKKAFLVLIPVMVVAGIVWYNVGAAPDTSSVPSMEVTVYSEFFTDAKAGSDVPAALYTAEEYLEEVVCGATETPGSISCQIPQTYAGQTLLIELTKNEIMHTQLVSIPAE